MALGRFFDSWHGGGAAASALMAAILALAPLLLAGARDVFPAERIGSIEKLTESLADLYGQHLRAPQSQKKAALARLQNVAALRYEGLAAAIEADPGAVLNVAIPGILRRGVPAALRRYLEEEVDLDGDLEVLYEDRTQGGRFRYHLKSRGEEYSLHFKSEPPTHLISGTRVRIRGVRVNHAVALHSAPNGLQTIAAPTSNALGEQSTLVLLVNFKNHPAQPYDASFASELIFKTTNNFLVENSYGQTFLSGVVKGWYTIDMDRPTSAATCNYSQISSLADQAAINAGVVLSNYRRKLYAFPQSGCGWWGLGTIGGNPSRAWINGNLQLRVAAHELGHNFGLYHSHSLDCSNEATGGPCMASEYGDTLDTMGSSAHHFNAFQKERLGWLAHGASPPITTAHMTGSYAIAPYETVAPGAKAVKILKSTDLTTGRSSYYYAECRRPLGFDGALSGNDNVLNGFIIRRAEESDGNSSHLLDLSPASESTNWLKPALMIGYSFIDPVAGVTITPQAPCGDDSPGSVAVTLGPSVCTQASPDISISPSDVRWLMPGGSATYTLYVTNRDGPGCGASQFNIAPVIRDGWSATLESAALAVAPGATGQTAITITIPPTAADGFYSFSAAASCAQSVSDGATAAAGLWVVSSFGVDVATNKSVYRRGQTSTITVTVTAAGAPVANATVTLTIIMPDGSQTAADVVTRRNGKATYRLRTNKREPSGDWQVQARTTMGGLTVSSAGVFRVD